MGDWNDISYGVTHGSQKQVSISGVGDEALNLVLPNQGSDLFVRKAADSAHRQERPLLMVGLKEPMQAGHALQPGARTPRELSFIEFALLACTTSKATRRTLD